MWTGRTVAVDMLRVGSDELTRLCWEREPLTSVNWFVLDAAYQRNDAML
jgi:hypothetical protein